MGLIARAEGIFYGSPMGCGSERTTMAVVAEISDQRRRRPLPAVGCVWSAAQPLSNADSRKRRHHPDA